MKSITKTEIIGQSGTLQTTSNARTLVSNSVPVQTTPSLETTLRQTPKASRSFPSSKNVISGNKVTANDQGMLLSSSSNNAVYHNDFINNSQQALSDVSPNTWDNSYSSGGNYWIDYNGHDLYHGPQQNQLGPDGLGDTPYTISTTNTDHYPLMRPWYAYSITFDESGVGSDFTATLLTVDGTLYDVTQMPLSFYWQVASSHTFAYKFSLTVGTNTKRYVWTSTTGLSTLQNGTIAVAGPGKVTGEYETQCYLTVRTIPTGITTIAGQGWYDASSATLLMAPQLPSKLFLYWDVDGVSQGDSLNPIMVQMNAPHNATAYYSELFVGGESFPINAIQLLTLWITTILFVTVLLVVVSIATYK